MERWHGGSTAELIDRLYQLEDDPYSDPTEAVAGPWLREGSHEHGPTRRIPTVLWKDLDSEIIDSPTASDLYKSLAPAVLDAYWDRWLRIAQRSMRDYEASVFTDDQAATEQRRHAAGVAIASAVAGGAAATGLTLLTLSLADGTVPNIYVALTATLAGFVLLVTLVAGLRESRSRSNGR